MIIAPLIYTRTRHIDYRLMAKPSPEACDPETLNSFVGFARQVINTDNYSAIKHKRWALMKKKNYILFGCGLYNTWLDNTYSTDEVNRIIRSFIGIVIDFETQPEWKPILSEELLLALLRQFVFPCWDDKKEKNNIFHPFNLDISIPEILLTDTSPAELNFDHSLTRLMPYDETLVEPVFHSILLTKPVDFNFVAALNSSNHAINEGFMNAAIIGLEKAALVENKKAKPDSVNLSLPSASEKVVDTKKIDWFFSRKKNKEQEEDDKRKPIDYPTTGISALSQKQPFGFESAPSDKQQTEETRATGNCNKDIENIVIDSIQQSKNILANLEECLRKLRHEEGQ